MGRYIVYGGKKLFGTVDIHGSKNAALPILCACIINSGINIIHNCPKITDVFNTCKILQMAGCTIKWENSTVIVDSSKAKFIEIGEDITSKMRSSIIFMGAFCGRFKKAVVSKPGGCKIGKRPLDIHIEALKNMGVVIDESNNCFVCDAKKLKSAEINLRFPSVGATENIMLVAAFADGKTVIKNAAVEPETMALAEFLNQIGVNTVCGDNVITICKKCDFCNAEYSIIPDRIEAGTFMAACACSGGEIFLKNADAHNMGSVIDAFDSMGSKIEFCGNGIYFKAPDSIIPQNIKTGIYPNFPTDMQPQIMAVLTLARGKSVVIESMFENRFNHAIEFNKMGANIEIDGKMAIIKGVKELYPKETMAFDLRGGAGLIMAALSCNGMSIINGSTYIKRGYENIEKSISGLGGIIKYEN